MKEHLSEEQTGPSIVLQVPQDTALHILEAHGDEDVANSLIRQEERYLY